MRIIFSLNFGKSWNVKSVAGNVLYVGSDGLSVLFQWYPANKNRFDF